MIYELTYQSYQLGLFPSEAEAMEHTRYLPKDYYTIQEWDQDGEFLIFSPQENKQYTFHN